MLPGVVAVILLTGCTTTTAGQARPDAGSTPDPGTETSDSTSDPDEPPSGEAPKVEDPIDTTKFQENPCLSLTPEQTGGELDVGTSGKVQNAALGKACEWQNDSTRGEVQIRFLDKDPRGLTPEYEAEEDGRWAYFEELPLIEGHPAVSRSQIDDRDQGICTVVVGASDEIAFEARVRQAQEDVGTTDPCDVAVDVAGMAVNNMKAG